MTALGAATWAQAKPFYDRLALRTSGDQPVEQYGSTKHGVDTRFPNYEAFWKYHVCPATDRPQSIGFADGINDTISLVAQRSYTVLAYVVEALEFARLVKTGDFGPRKRNAYIAIMYAGNALQVFSELQYAICGPAQKLPGKTTIADHVSRSLQPFPDWKTNWGPRRESIVSYRNYLTHQGWFYTVEKAGNEPLVLKQEFVPRDAFTWTDADRDYDAAPTHWGKLSDTCEQIVDEALDWLNDAYGAMCVVLDPFLQNADYQKLWGWKAGRPIPCLALKTTSPQADQPTSTTHGDSRINMTGSTSSRVESDLSVLKDDGPPGSGIRQE